MTNEDVDVDATDGKSADDASAEDSPSADSFTAENAEQRTPTDASASKEDVLTEATTSPTKGRDGVRRSWVGYAILGIATATLLVALAGSGYLGWSLWQEHEVHEAGREAQEAARNYAHTLTSIDSNHIDQNFKQVLDGATGDFKDMYTKSSVQLRQLLIDNKATAESTVVDSAIQSESPNKVVVLLMVDQKIVNAVRPDPRVDRSRMKITMEKVDGRWLASKVELP